MKKLTAFIAAATMVIGSFSVNTFAAEAEKTVSLRIEGKSETYFYGNVTTTADNVADLMSQVNAENNDITMDIQSSQYGTYIAGINDDAAGSIAPAYYDGWSDMINGIAPSVGVDSQIINDGDVIVFFYNDEYGSHGFAYPEVDTTNVNEGIIKITSPAYDDNYQPITVNVTGATVKVDGETYTTDDNGEIVIAEALRTNGEHSIQISKVAEDGMPLVLRSASDYKVTFEGIEEAEEEETETETETSQEESSQEEVNQEKPEDGGAGVSNVVVYFGVLFLAAVVGTVVLGRKKAYEK